MAKTEIKSEISLNTTKFQRGMAKAQRSISKFAKSGIAQIARFGAAFAGIGLIKSIASLGLSAGETASKFKAIFGPALDEMNQKVKELRKTIPATTAEMQNALSTFAAMAKGFGLNTEAANMFSVEMVKVAGDIASFHDLPIEEAFTKIRSAISGEFEPMKQLGIVINEARLKQEGLNLAIWDGSGQMSAAQKALAVQSIMIRDMGDANGDAAITANSAANQVKFLKKDLAEMGTEIGTTLLPAMTKLVGWFAAAAKGAKSMSEAVGKFMGELVYEGSSSARKELEDQVMLRAKVIAQLKEEGKIRKESPALAFSKEARDANLKEAKIIKDRMAAINAESKAKIKADKDAAAAKKKEDEEAIKNAEDLSAELEKQIDAETDPKRKQALQERLKAYQDLLSAAGKLESLQTAKPKTGKNGGSSKSSASASGSLFESIEARDDLEKRRADKLRKAGQDIIDDKMSDFERESHTLRERRAERERLESELQDSIREDRDYNRTSKERFESQMNGSTNASQATADAAQGGPSTEAAIPTSESIQYAKESAESLEVIKEELTRSSR